MAKAGSFYVKIGSISHLAARITFSAASSKTLARLFQTNVFDKDVFQGRKLFKPITTVKKLHKAAYVY